MTEIKLEKRLPNLSPEEEQIFTEAIVEAYQRGIEDQIRKTPSIVKKDFTFDSNLGWYMTMQIDWGGHKWFICQQIPNEPSAYITGLLRGYLKNAESQDDN